MEEKDISYYGIIEGTQHKIPLTFPRRHKVVAKSLNEQLN